MIHRIKKLAVVFLAAAFPASVFAQRSADAVRAAIEKALDKEKIEARVEIEGSNVVLTGKVRNVFEKNKAVAIALEEPEVEAVDTNVEVSAAESDNALGEAVVREIRRYGNLTIFDDAAAIVRDGSVVLMGFVTEPYKKTGIEERLHDVIGIQEFDNQIKVLPTSMQDENLRRALANRLYRDSMFSDFARMAHPPIRIIVERSRVLLTGVVNTQMAKQRAESIVRQTPGVLSVENRLRVGS